MRSTFATALALCSLSFCLGCGGANQSNETLAPIDDGTAAPDPTLTDDAGTPAPAEHVDLSVQCHHTRNTGQPRCEGGIERPIEEVGVHDVDPLGP